MTIDESFRELGLSPGSSDAEVKEAWRRLAARWHPDRNASPHALRKIQRINRAIEEIRQWRKSGFADLQQTSEAPADMPEESVEQQVSITLEEACSGCSRELHGEVVEACAECHGSGHEVRASTCPHGADPLVPVARHQPRLRNLRRQGRGARGLRRLRRQGPHAPAQVPLPHRGAGRYTGR